MKNKNDIEVLDFKSNLSEIVRKQINICINYVSKIVNDNTITSTDYSFDSDNSNLNQLSYTARLSLLTLRKLRETDGNKFALFLKDLPIKDASKIELTNIYKLIHTIDNQLLYERMKSVSVDVHNKSIKAYFIAVINNNITEIIEKETQSLSVPSMNIYDSFEEEDLDSSPDEFGVIEKNEEETRDHTVNPAELKQRLAELQKQQEEENAFIAKKLGKEKVKIYNFSSEEEALLPDQTLSQVEEGSLITSLNISSGISEPANEEKEIPLAEETNSKNINNNDPHYSQNSILNELHKYKKIKDQAEDNIRLLAQILNENIGIKDKAQEAIKRLYDQYIEVNIASLRDEENELSVDKSYIMNILVENSLLGKHDECSEE